MAVAAALPHKHGQVGVLHSCMHRALVVSVPWPSQLPGLGTYVAGYLNCLTFWMAR